MADCSAKTWTIYRHVNKITGESYVGQTSHSVEERWQDGHGYDSQEFGKAIKKYGWDNFTHEILVSGITDLALADRYEIYYIKKFRCGIQSNFIAECIDYAYWQKHKDSSSRPITGYNVRAGGHWSSRLSILTTDEREKLIQYYTHWHKRQGWLKAMKELFPGKEHLSLDTDDPDEVYREIYHLATVTGLYHYYTSLRYTCYYNSPQSWEELEHREHEDEHIEYNPDGTVKYIDGGWVTLEECRDHFRKEFRCEKKVEGRQEIPAALVVNKESE